MQIASDILDHGHCQNLAAYPQTVHTRAGLVLGLAMLQHLLCVNKSVHTSENNAYSREYVLGNLETRSMTLVYGTNAYSHEYALLNHDT